MSQVDAGISPRAACGRLHHLGFVVKAIEEVVVGLAQTTGADWDAKTYRDPLQGVRVAFLRSRYPAEPMIELVEPTVASSPVSGFLRRGGGLHHLCYEVINLEEQLEFSRALGGLVIRAPLPAVAFGGRRIAWVYTKGKLLVEYLEHGRPCGIDA